MNTHTKSAMAYVLFPGKSASRSLGSLGKPPSRPCLPGMASATKHPRRRCPHRWDTAPEGTLLSQLMGRQVHVTAKRRHRQLKAAPSITSPCSWSPLAQRSICSITRTELTHVKPFTASTDAPCLGFYGTISNGGKAGTHPLSTASRRLWCSNPALQIFLPGCHHSTHS